VAVVTVNCFMFCRNKRFSPQKCTFLINVFLFLTLNKQRTPKLIYRVPSALWTVSRVATTIGRPCERCCVFWIVLPYLFLIRRVKSGPLIILLSNIMYLTHTHTHTHTYIYIYTHTHTHIYIYICVCVCVYIYICVCVCVYIYICVCVYIYIYIYVCVVCVCIFFACLNDAFSYGD